jgi:TRAP-type C4-dicarboxylate transport system substrate-binding protein
MIEANTNGQINITKHPAGSIAPGTEVLSATVNGILDMTVTIGGYNAGAVPAAAVEDGLPMQWTSKKQMTDILWNEGLEDLMRPEYAKQGVYLLGDFDAGGVGTTLFTTDKMASLDEIKGKKIRSWGPYLTFLENLEASPITMALGEVYSALQMGALDGTLVVASMVPLNKFNEVAPYGFLPQFSWGATHTVLINQAKWDELPADLQKIVIDTFDEWKVWDSDVYNPEFNYVTVDDLKELGVQFTTLSDADVAKAQAAAEKIWDDVAAKDPVAAQAIEIVRKYNSANPQ